MRGKKAVFVDGEKDFVSRCKCGQEKGGCARDPL
jgi:hypothetical protein